MTFVADITFGELRTAKLSAPAGFEDFSGLMGMSEMEGACRIIMSRCVTARSWEVVFSVGEFKADDHDLTGFCCLIANGWIVPAGYPDGAFVLTPNLVQRFVERACRP